MVPELLTSGPPGQLLSINFPLLLCEIIVRLITLGCALAPTLSCTITLFSKLVCAYFRDFFSISKLLQSESGCVMTTHTHKWMVALSEGSYLLAKAEKRKEKESRTDENGISGSVSESHCELRSSQDYKGIPVDTHTSMYLLQGVNKLFPSNLQFVL